jgi:hypothetical protein
MSMSQPTEPSSGGRDDGIPADAAGDHADPPDEPGPSGDDTPFRTHDPGAAGREG